MHAIKSIAVLLGLTLMAGACSSELDDAQPLAIGTTGSDAAFSYYDTNGDLVVSAKDIYEREKQWPNSAIKSEEHAAQIMSDFDLNMDGSLDNVEFTGMIHAKVLSGLKSRSR